MSLERGLYIQTILRFLSTYYCAESFFLFLKICYGKTEFSIHKTVLILYEEALGKSVEHWKNQARKYNTRKKKKTMSYNTILTNCGAKGEREEHNA